MRSKTFAFLVALIVMSFILVQCSPASPAAPPEPAKVQEEAPAATEVKEAPAETKPEQAAAKRVLRISFSWPNRIDPAVGNDYASSTSLANLYDSLIFPNAKGGVDPWVAESWKVSDDGLTFTFALRQDVKFHDGAPLKASDVVFSYNRLKSIGEGYAYLVTADVEGIKAVDDYGWY